jgi:hypothetical protein
LDGEQDIDELNRLAIDVWTDHVLFRPSGPRRREKSYQRSCDASRIGAGGAPGRRTGPGGVAVEKFRKEEIQGPVSKDSFSQGFDFQGFVFRRIRSPRICFSVWRDVGQRLLDNTCTQRTGRHEEDGCWPSYDAP